MSTKPLGRKNYGSIPHLSGSKIGPGDHYIHEGQERILLEKIRDRHDCIIVTEKYDGSNVGIAKLNGQLLALTRAGYEANTSRFEQHHHFSDWVTENKSTFDKILTEGERLVGEWMMQAHGLRYVIPEDQAPFIAFDLITPDNLRITQNQLVIRLTEHAISMPRILQEGPEAKSVSSCQELLFANNFDQEIISAYPEKPEGMVYRVERKGQVDFLAKWVRPDFVPGKYLTEITGHESIWNWWPKTG